MQKESIDFKPVDDLSTSSLTYLTKWYSIKNWLLQAMYVPRIARDIQHAIRHPVRVKYNHVIKEKHTRPQHRKGLPENE